MLDRVAAAIVDALRTDPPPLPADEVAETIDFLEWLKDNNFTFLGIREWRLEADGHVLAGVPSSSLGVLRGDQGEAMTPDGGRDRALAAGAGHVQGAAACCIITKTNARSRVHRQVPMDIDRR